MHMQPIYRLNPFITREDGKPLDMGADIFARGLCLPSDNKMTKEQQDRVIEVVRGCFEQVVKWKLTVYDYFVIEC